MAINLTNPININTTFDKVAISELRIFWPRLQGGVKADYVLLPYAEDEYGVKTAALNAPVRGRINDLFKLAEDRAADGKPKLGQAITLVLEALEEIEKEKGTI
jgi:hypothetical protein